MVEDSFKRHVAKKINISSILNGSYIKEEGDKPNHLILSNGVSISRVNVMGVVLSKSEKEGTDYSSVIIDDGTNNIPIRSFEKNKKMGSLVIGDVIMLIGKIREYGNERYVLPEIIRNVNDYNWIEVRKLELNHNLIIKKEEEIYDIKKENIENASEGVLESSSQVVFELIKYLDNGNGVDVEDVVNGSKVDNTEKIISDLLREGDVFELKPGRLKVLE